MSPRPTATTAAVHTEARRLLARLESVDLDRYSVVGKCLRFDEQSRNLLKEFRQRLAETFLSNSRAPKNFLLWGAPGSGKSYLVQQVAKSLPPEVNYRELNLAEEDLTTFRAGLEAFAKVPRPGLCFIDEVDAHSDQVWPYETLLPFLDPPVPRRHQTAYCLAGSSGSDITELIEMIRSRPKGPDLVNRIPKGNEFPVLPLGVGDKVLVSVVQLVLAAQEEGRTVREIEKLALYYLAVHPSFTSARQLRSRTAQCAQRIPPAEDRVRYDYLFRAGDPENKQFWNQSELVRKGLENSFVRVVQARVETTAPAKSPEAQALRPLPPVIARSIPRIAVLPLANISPDPKDEYFADGLTEELISVLSQLKGLRVISHTSVNQYKETSKPIAQIGSELGADAVLEGSVRKAGDQLRIAVQLIDTRTDEHRWAAIYDRRLDNIFAIQAEVAERAAAALKVELLKGEREAIHEKPTSSLRAYESYLRGVQKFYKGAFEATLGAPEVLDKETTEYFEEAIREDPQFSAAYSFLANHLLAVMGTTRPAKEVVPRARELVTKALELDPNSSEAHTALGNLAFQADLDWSRAEAEFQQAIALNPSSSTARFWYAYLLGALGRLAEAKKQYLNSIELDPLWLLPRMNLVWTIRIDGNYSSALEECEKVVERFGHSGSTDWAICFLSAILGRSKESLRLVEPLVNATDYESRSLRSYTLALLGKPEELRALVDDVEAGRVTGYSMGSLGSAVRYALLGDREKAIRSLEEDCRSGERALWNTYNDEFWDGLRDDPRFIALLREMHLPTEVARPLFAFPLRAPG